MSRNIQKWLAVLFVMAISLMGTLSAKEKRTQFPPELTNKNRKAPKAVKGVETQQQRMNFSVDNNDVEILVIHPKNIENKTYPLVYFIQEEGEHIDTVIKKMENIAGMGYVVGGSNYRNYDHVEKTFFMLQALEYVDTDRMAVLGVTKGVEHAMYLGCQHPESLRGMVVVSGKPPYDKCDLINQLKCPILLIHGDVDYQVPCGVSEYFYHDYTSHGKKAELFRVYGGLHYLNDAEWERSSTEFMKFFSAYLAVQEEIPQETQEDSPHTPQSSPSSQGGYQER